MKSSPLIEEFKKHQDKFSVKLIHTGQHYDHNLSQLFFDHLKMPKPDIHLGVGSGSHAEQTAKIMVELEKVLLSQKPDLVVVFGDVNSTLAAALNTAKIGIKLAHVEAGLRSFDNTMPEEINRIITDRLSDYLFVSEKSGLNNLAKEGIANNKIFFVGNIMIDALINNLEIAGKSDILEKLKLKPREYILMTMHRPANVDNEELLAGLLKAIDKISKTIPVVFPCHPRTANRLEEFGLLSGLNSQSLRLIDPLGYLDFLHLQAESKFVLTDSGGIQEETTFLKIPCITMRDNTERPITVEIGSNVIAGTKPQRIIEEIDQILSGKNKICQVPELWDGQTAVRIVETLIRVLE
ncbi:MAG: UDP-N-acetylglucosamine 2-epimerase (non-hydrolyzing) [candidate division Zixibacteria bacterium]|nr:UDP-N-acetylglucosamine 2-epimerase (non-hydrolyzing) [candidate division Zixibacteria bacterium]